MRLNINYPEFRRYHHNGSPHHSLKNKEKPAACTKANIMISDGRGRLQKRIPDSPRTVRRCFSLVNVSFLGSATFWAAFLISPSLLDFLNIAKATDIWPLAPETLISFHISSAVKFTCNGEVFT